MIPPVAPAVLSTEAAEKPLRVRTVLAGGLLAITLASLDQNIVNTALPRMVEDLGGVTHLAWVVTAFMLTSTVTTPLYGKLSDMYGRRTLFFVAIPVFLIGSLLCGAAHSMLQIIVFRAIQGLGAGGLMVLSQAAIGDVVSPRERPRYQGLFTGTMALASVAGPLIGGIITSALSWRWVFYVNLPIGLLALAMIAAGLGRAPPGPSRSIDYAGTVLLTGATTALLLLMAWGGTEIAWASWASAGLLSLTAALGAAFLWWEARAPEPLVRLKLFHNAVFARGVAVSGMMVFAMMGSTVFLPLYFQVVLGMDPAVSGFMMLPQVAGMVLTSIVGGRMVARRGRNKSFLLTGLGLEAAGLAGLALLAWLAASPAVFLVALGILGLGMGMGMPNLTTAVQNAVAHRELGSATGTMAFSRSLGGALGVAASGTIMSAGLAVAVGDGRIDLSALTGHRLFSAAALDPALHAAVSTAYRTALAGCFLLSGAVMTVAFLLVFGLPEVMLRSEIRGRTS